MICICFDFLWDIVVLNFIRIFSYLVMYVIKVLNCFLFRFKWCLNELDWERLWFRLGKKKKSEVGERMVMVLEMRLEIEIKIKRFKIKV